MYVGPMDSSVGSFKWITKTVTYYMEVTIMGKMATKKAAKQLQQLFDFLGEFGGVIETNMPENWWNLDLEVEQIEGDKKNILVGVYSSVSGDVIYDPVFHVVAREEDDKIAEVEVLDCEETTVLGTSTVDGDDMIHGFGTTEKDPFGLKNRFTSFMDNMTGSGPYLTEPKSVKKYTKTLAD